MQSTIVESNTYSTVFHPHKLIGFVPANELDVCRATCASTHHIYTVIGVVFLPLVTRPLASQLSRGLLFDLLLEAATSEDVYTHQWQLQKSAWPSLERPQTGQDAATRALLRRTAAALSYSTYTRV